MYGWNLWLDGIHLHPHDRRHLLHGHPDILLQSSPRRCVARGIWVSLGGNSQSSPRVRGDHDGKSAGFPLNMACTIPNGLVTSQKRRSAVSDQIHLGPDVAGGDADLGAGECRWSEAGSGD